MTGCIMASQLTTRKFDETFIIITVDVTIDYIDFVAESITTSSLHITIYDVTKSHYCTGSV